MRYLTVLHAFYRSDSDQHAVLRAPSRLEICHALRGSNQMICHLIAATELASAPVFLDSLDLSLSVNRCRDLGHNRLPGALVPQLVADRKLAVFHLFAELAFVLLGGKCFLE